jgi:hypothetical protein
LFAAKELFRMYELIMELFRIYELSKELFGMYDKVAIQDV